MKISPLEIYEEYRAAAEFKSAIGSKGMYEQNRINERFYVGDQWYGAKCGNDRPLVRHNVIKRIGDYKMSQILSDPLSVTFTAEGIPTGSYALGKSEEINRVMEAFGDYYNVTAERVKLNDLHEQVLRNAYITGTGVLYTYWDETVKTGLYADADRKTAIKGDIASEVLNIENVFFSDPYTESLQSQAYIIISSCRDISDVLREAKRSRADKYTLRALEDEADDGKITVLTKLYKEYKEDGSYTIKSVKVTERAILRRSFDTGLKMYPLAIFTWERRGGIIYGESEITYLIPNQIAINRMITAGVWSAMTTGMPMMVINGDTVPDGISNEPGQIIKVFGSNEDVAGAVKYISPPDYSSSFQLSTQSLIDNTLTQSGANEVALGDSRPDNAAALMTMRNAALMPLQTVKNRFYSFAEEVSRIWADFWVTYYGRREIKLVGADGIRYEVFEAEDYKGLIINAKTDVGVGRIYSETERINTLITLYEKGVIDRIQLLKRMPDGIIPDKIGLIKENTEREYGKDENNGI